MEDKQETIKEILIRRDGMSPEDAQRQIDDAKETLDYYLDNCNFTAANTICEEFFGLEPDYLDELLAT